jgi:N-acetylmuramoyl-L-alanine amidase
MIKYVKMFVVAVLILGVVVFGDNYVKSKQTANIIHDVPGWSWVMGGKVVTIDAGHGGVDPGAVGVNNTLEKNINLEISKRLKLLFEQAGCQVIMLREDDRDFGTSSKLLQRKREDLAYRIQKATESNADIYLSIHANSFTDQRQQGPQVFYHPESVEGKHLAQSIQTSLNKLSTKKRVAKSNQTYFILKNTNMVAVTIEVGFLSNPQEESKLNQVDYQGKMAMAIFEGVGNYLAAEKPVINND